MSANKWALLATTLTLVALGFAAMSTNPSFNIPIWVPYTFFIAAAITFLWLITLLIRRKKPIKASNQTVIPSNNIATQIITVSILEEFGYEFQVTADSLRLRFSPGIYASPAVKVEDIKLEIRGERYDTNWKPMEEAVSGDIDKGVYMYVSLPKSFKSGIYQARILACIENKWYPSKPYTLSYQQPTLDKGGSK